MCDLIHQSNQESWYWVAKKLAQERQTFSNDELLAVVKDKPAMTVTELMSKTDCTLSEARKVLDQHEWS